MQRICGRGLFLIVAAGAVMIGFAIPCAAQAQTTLLWRLAAGDKLAVNVAQNTKSSVSYAGKTTATEIDLSLQLAWEVVHADSDRFQIKQTLEQLKTSFVSSAGRVDYDSAATARPTGPARELSASVAPLLGFAASITMNGRGEIIDAKAANEAAEKLFASAEGGAPGPAGPKETIQQLLKQPLVILPEKSVAPGDEWSTINTLKTSLGEVQQTITYRYVGPVDEDGMKLDKIDSTTTLTPATAEAGKLTLKEHRQTGTILFNSAAGRAVRAEQNQKLVTERPYRETRIVVALESKQTTTISATQK